MQAGRSEGLLSRSLQSNDGGYEFHGADDLSFADANAMAYRADLSVGIGDFFKGRGGRVALYVQNLAAGYSAPGQATIKDTNYYGGTFTMPVTSQLSLRAKGDERIEDQGLKTRAIEMDVAYKLTDRWSLSAGVRNDLRKDRSLVVPQTQEQGWRTDAVAQVTFIPVPYRGPMASSRTRWRPGADVGTTDASERAVPTARRNASRSTRRLPTEILGSAARSAQPICILNGPVFT